MQIVDKVKDKLGVIFAGVPIRSLGRTIRFNVDKLADGPLIALGLLSIHEACEIAIKRSGTGLVIIIEV